MNTKDKNQISKPIKEIADFQAQLDFSEKILMDVKMFKGVEDALNLSNKLLAEIEAAKVVDDLFLSERVMEQWKTLSDVMELSHTLDAFDVINHSKTDLEMIQFHLENATQKLFHSVKFEYESLLPELISGIDQGYTLPDEALKLFVTTSLSGNTQPNDLKKFLTTLSDRLPTDQEMLGGALSLRSSMVEIGGHQDAIDVVGTGGDGHNTFNISTATAFVVASQEVKVAKHGNRSASSKSGAADVLEALGANIHISPTKASKSLEEIGLAFLFAQTYHPTLKKVAAARREIGKRTIFNLLGPLSNPAKVRRTVLGVYDENLLEPMAKALSQLGAERAWVVHGHDGMDEVTTTGPTSIAKIDAGIISREELTPERFGLKRTSMEQLKGGDAQENAKAILDLLDGKQGAFRDVVLLNAAVTFAMAGKTNDIQTGIEAAKEAIGSGRAKNMVRKLISFSNS